MNDAQLQITTTDLQTRLGSDLYLRIEEAMHHAIMCNVWDHTTMQCRIHVHARVKSITLENTCGALIKQRLDERRF